MILLIVDEWPVGIIASQIKPTHFDFFCSSGFAFLFPPLEWLAIPSARTSINIQYDVNLAFLYLLNIYREK